MTDPAPGLAAALADRYRIERELGQGGMATVYLAEDLKHHRKVAVKVLRPDLAASLGATRFLREIEIAAQLQHPHILPLLDSGSAEGSGGSLLYYVMPFVEGESLRDRLNREGELPSGEAVRILREVVDALSYAHARGVVHRDIKPDNVMLSGRHALVTDFGVAKAVSEATGRQTMTTVGVALGTPAYMAPEQAAADPHVDHRADIYAVGAMGYELLAGRPPFVGLTPQQVLAAHVTENPEPVTRYRPAIAPALAEVVMRCLAKRPADRWQSADELLEHLEPLGTPSGGTTPTSATAAQAGPARSDPWYTHPFRVGALYLVAAVATLGVAYFITVRLGLPDWVLKGAAALLVAGLPVMILTALIERSRAQAKAAGTSPAPARGGWSGWLTWRKAILAGVLAFAALGLGTAAYTAMRLLGIGPVGTLVATGSLKTRDRLLVAGFLNHAADTTLGSSMTEAFRIDLAQSPVVAVLGSSEVADALKRMERDPNKALDAAATRELALRTGSKAVVTGEISPVGKGYVLSAKLLSASDGAELVALRETAQDDGGLLGAIDRLSKRMRERIGESLRSIRANDPLELVTTSSLPALRFYTQGLQASSIGKSDEAIDFLEQAIAADSGFAMAYRKLAVLLSNSGVAQTRMIAASTKAYQHRDRLPEVERYLAIAWYFDVVEFDKDKANAAYRSVLEVNPDHTTALNNLGVNLEERRQYAEAEKLFLRAVEHGSAEIFYTGLIRMQLAQRKTVEARATVERFAKEVPNSRGLLLFRANIAAGAGAYDSAETYFRQARETSAGPTQQVDASRGLAAVALVQGKLAVAERHFADVLATREKMGLPGAYLAEAASPAWTRAHFRGDPTGALKAMDSALSRHPWATIAPLDRPGPTVATFYAWAGQPARARQLMAEYESTVPESIRRGDPLRHRAAGAIALAEGRGAEAVAAYRDLRGETGWVVGGLAELARAYELAGQRDSALAAYQEFVDGPPAVYRIFDDQWDLARSLKALGELYQGRHNREKALEYYTRFVRLWKDADPELQPQVREVKQSMAQLAGEPRK